MNNIINNYKEEWLTEEIEEEIREYIKYLAKELKSTNNFSLVFMDNEEIQIINKQFRDKNRPTDVLTFCEGEQYLGDILISVDKIKEQANEYKHSEQRELMFLITHGYLHLHGYDHQNETEEKEMFDLQKKLLNQYGIRRNNGR